MPHDHDHDHDHYGHGHAGHAPAGHDHAGHSHSAMSGHTHGVTDKKRVLIAAALTSGFMVVEAAGGILTGSLALLADAGHMLTDAVALILAWYAFHLAGREATPRLTYGFDRLKTLVAYTNGVAVFAIGLWIVVEAFHRLSNPAPVLGWPMLVIAGIGLAVNIGTFLVLRGGDRESLNMRGAILHVLGDLLGSVAAIMAAVVILFTGWVMIDPILSALVAVLLFRASWGLVRESGHLLLEGVPDSLNRDEIAADLQKHIAGVTEVHHMHVWSLDGVKNMATLHACLAEGADAIDAVRAIKVRLATRHSISHATVEPEFGHCADAQPRYVH